MKLSDKVANVWLVVSTIALAILAYLFHRQGRKLSSMAYTLQREKLAAKLRSAKEKRDRLEGNREKAQKDYDMLLRRYGDVAKRLGLKPDGESADDSDTE